MLVSVLITCYNYEKYVSSAINSALDQTYSNIEIVVVDDGSSDNSRNVILGYGNKIIPIIKDNGGHTSAINAAFEASGGDILCLLDADDFFYPNKVQIVVDFLNNVYCGDFVNKHEQDILIYHPLEIVNSKGKSLGKRYPEKKIDYPTNMYEYARKYKYLPFVTGPTSGLAFTRNLAKKIFPLPDSTHLMSGEDFIVRPASLLGKVHCLDSLLATYRLHGNNDWFGHEYGKSKEWLLIHQDFLNQRLLENEKEPVISYFDSTYARNFYEREKECLEMIRLAFTVIKDCKDFKAVRFFTTTLLKAAKLSMMG